MTDADRVGTFWDSCENPRTTPFEAKESWQREDSQVGVNIFVIHGKGIQLPNDGAALRDQLKVCGAKEDSYCGGWQYEWNEDGEPLEEGGTVYWWYALDCFPSTVDMGCVVDAIKKSGGPASTTCTKREWKKISAQQPANVTASNVTASNVTASKMVESSTI
jgi:hypothetical protein